MLTPISWQEYLIAVSIFATAYYAIVLIAYFKAEAIAIFKTNRSPEAITTAPSHPDIMGKVKEDTFNQHLPADELEFSSENEFTNESNNNSSYEKHI